MIILKAIYILWKTILYSHGLMLHHPSPYCLQICAEGMDARMQSESRTFLLLFFLNDSNGWTDE